MLRVIAGTYRRQILRTLSDSLITRPTADRVRENIFNILQNEISGARVADLFSGTGAMGIEALSRGAASCVFVEKDLTAAQLIESNLVRLKIPSDTWKIIKGDTSAFLQSMTSQENAIDRNFDLFFADPPYDSTWYQKAVSEVFSSERTSKNCSLCIEMNKYTDLAEQATENWKRVVRKQYGKSCIEIWKQEVETE